MPKLVQTQLGESEYELLKDFKEKNGLKTDYQGLKELVKALDIPEFKQAQNTQFTPVDTFVFYDTQGHGYLRVRKELLDGLSLTDKISRYSYTDPKNFWVYLEEDNDLGIFLKKLDKKSLEELNYTTKHVKEDYFDVKGLGGVGGFVNYPFYKQEVKTIDRTNLENWVKDLGFEQERQGSFIGSLKYVFRGGGMDKPTEVQQEGDYYQVITHSTNVPMDKEVYDLLKEHGKHITGIGYTNKKGILIHIAR